MVELAAHRSQARLNVAETLAVSELSEGHRQILIPARQTSVVLIAVIASHTLLELEVGEMSDQLRENGSAGIHPPLFRRCGVQPFNFYRCFQFKSFSGRMPAILWMAKDLPDFAKYFTGHQCCPINSYISLYSTTGRVMVRSVSSQTCSGCTEKFCLTGSVKGWGCPYGLCVGEIDRNNDCGACMECVKTCAYDNVAVFWRNEGWDKEIASYGEVWQAIVMFALACLYSIINLGSWDRIRDWIDIVDKQHWGSFSVYALVVWVICLGVLPLLWYLLT